MKLFWVEQVDDSVIRDGVIKKPLIVNQRQLGKEDCSLGRYVSKAVRKGYSHHSRLNVDNGINIFALLLHAVVHTCILIIIIQHIYGTKVFSYLNNIQTSTHNFPLVELINIYFPSSIIFCTYLKTVYSRAQTEVECSIDG